LSNDLFMGRLWRHSTGGSILCRWGYALPLIGIHLLFLVAVTCSLPACGCSQQSSLAATPSNALNNVTSQVMPRSNVGYQFVSGSEEEDFQNTALSSRHVMFSFKQDESTMDRNWFSLFTAGGVASRNCDASYSQRLHSRISVSARNDLLFDGARLASIGSGADNQQNPPQSQKHESSAETGSPKHIFFFVPAFHVSYLTQFKPLTPREKFDEWAHGTYDPRGLLLYAGEAATLEHSSRDGFCGYGKTFGRYSECFGSMELDANISSFFGDFLFTVALHQDPRYFRLGTGSFGARAVYAVSRVFVTHADSGRMVFFSSATAGSVLAAAASNLYFPVKDRGVTPSLQRLAIDFGDTALFNVAAEFWPDISQKLGRVLRKP